MNTMSCIDQNSYRQGQSVRTDVQTERQTFLKHYAPELHVVRQVTQMKKRTNKF